MTPIKPYKERIEGRFLCAHCKSWAKLEHSSWKQDVWNYIEKLTAIYIDNSIIRNRLNKEIKTLFEEDGT